jgi:hypothetical protein
MFEVGTTRHDIKRKRTEATILIRKNISYSLIQMDKACILFAIYRRLLQTTLRKELLCVVKSYAIGLDHVTFVAKSIINR